MSKLSVGVDDYVAMLRIGCESTRNAIDITIIRAIHSALDDLDHGKLKARAVVITGCNGVFCSGVDLHSVDLETEEARQRAHFDMRRFMDPLILRLSGFRYPIVAAVNGPAVGAGMSLALASDIIVVAEGAYFCPSFARLGLVPDAGITFNLARRIGAGRSLATLMLAERIDAHAALAWGLAYAVAPAAEIAARAHDIARRLAVGPSAVLSSIRQLQSSSFNATLKDQLRAELSAQATALQSHDCIEGVAAFFEKREPHFLQAEKP
ncbi:MAG TPA: enoyl-CoA hydratase-related protein [Steroidobacteraceae bacterium]